MLVVTLEKDGSVVIGDGENQIEVFIVDTRGKRIRVGVQAPAETRVLRREVYDRIQVKPDAA